MRTVAVTGHRPEKINDPEWVKNALYVCMYYLQVDRLIQGMAAGVDLWSARAAFQAEVPYWCARPWMGHMPRVADRKEYESALKHAERIINVNESSQYPGAWVYQKRNEWMVDNADMVLAVWDGSTGGTFNALKYARKQEKKIFLIDPVEKSMGYIDE